MIRSLSQFEGAQGLVCVTPADIFPNCPRNIPRMKVRGGLRATFPAAALSAVEPGWKAFEAFADVVPPRRA